MRWWRDLHWWNFVVNVVVSVFVVLWLLLWLPGSAHCEPVHVHSASHVVTDGGSKLDLPPGYFYDEALHAALDVEVKRLQDVETRLTAENESLRKTLSTWQPPTYLLVTTFVIGLGLGAYLVSKL